MTGKFDRMWSGVREWASGIADRRAEDAVGGEVPSGATREAAQSAQSPPAEPQRVPAPPDYAPAVRGDRPEPATVLPWGMRVAGEASWRLLVLAGVIWVLIQVVSTVSLLILAFSAGLLVTALLQPTVARLKRLGLGRGLATAVTFITGFVVIGLIGWFVVWQITDNLPTLTDRVQDGIKELKSWAVNGPFHVSEDQINNIATTVSDWLGDNSQAVTSAGLEGVTALFEFLSGALLAMFVTLFLLYDGRRIWNWTLNFVPANAREGVAGAGPRAWITLTGYVRGTVIVAMIDAISIGIGLYFLDVPMAVPLAVFIFVFAFVPIVGAIISGALAVLVAIVTNGVFTALLVLAVVLAVQQIESHILQPFILGRLVRVHPLAVVLAVTGGSLIAGIAGAVVSVPLVAVLNTVVGYLRRYSTEQAEQRAAIAQQGVGEGPPAPAAVHVASGAEPGAAAAGAAPADTDATGDAPPAEPPTDPNSGWQ